MLRPRIPGFVPPSWFPALTPGAGGRYMVRRSASSPMVFPLSKSRASVVKDPTCLRCNMLETMEHLLYACDHYSAKIWALFSRAHSFPLQAHWGIHSSHRPDASRGGLQQRPPLCFYTFRIATPRKASSFYSRKSNMT
jgi:hypothetical protein